jgi:hypothetical protein
LEKIQAELAGRRFDEAWLASLKKRVDSLGS